MLNDISVGSKDLMIVISSAVLVLAKLTVVSFACSNNIIFPSFKSIVVPDPTVCLINAVEPAPVKPLPSP